MELDLLLFNKIGLSKGINLQINPNHFKMFGDEAYDIDVTYKIINIGSVVFDELKDNNQSLIIKDLCINVIDDYKAFNFFSSVHDYITEEKLNELIIKEPVNELIDIYLNNINKAGFFGWYDEVTDEIVCTL